MQKEHGAFDCMLQAVLTALALIDTIEAQQQEIEQLREVCIKGFSYLSLLFHRGDIRNWNTVGMCSVRDVKNVLSELENTYNATKQSVSCGGNK